MTREEAVDELDDLIKLAEYVDSAYIDCASVDAVKMAISALSVPETNVGDMISRQAAIDELDGVKVDEEYCDEYDIGYNDGINFAVSKLSVLPSAQQKGHWIKDEYGAEYCSECLKYPYDDGEYHIANWESDFCPNCGAEMKGEEDENNNQI